MKKADLGNVVKVALVILFALVLFYIRLDRVYEEKWEEYSAFVPTNLNTGYSIRKVEHIVAPESEKTAAVEVFLKPGDTYEGSLLVKNHAVEKQKFYLQLRNMVELEEEGGNAVRTDRNDGVFPVVNYDDAKFDLKGKEWRLLDYEIEIPEDIPEGYYEAVMALRNEDVIKKDNVDIVFAVGVDLKIHVLDNPPVYEYERVIDDVNLSELVNDAVVLEVKKIVSVGLGILAIFFFYKAFTTKKEKVNTTNKKTKEVGLKKE